MSDNSPYLFWPDPIGPYETELKDLALSISQAPTGTEMLSIVERQLDRIPIYRNADVCRLRYRAYMLVMRDLLRQGWECTYRQGRIFLSPPSWTEEVCDPDAIREQKDTIRQALNYERLAQLQTPSVRKFIAYMESSRMFGEQTVSVFSLFADGIQLAEELEIVARLPKSAQEQQVAKVIQPYLQLVTSKKRCQYTGLRLQDIWRYIRYTWSIPYNSTPGRNMFYLVRDAARPFHPIVGIAALGNSLMQITVRDNAIGWTPHSVFKRISAADFTQEEAVRMTQMLHSTLQLALDDTATHDLIDDQDRGNPTEQTLQALRDIEDREKTKRIELLQKYRTLSQATPASPGQMSLEGGEICESELPERMARQAQQVLFRSKRARIARELLAARLYIESTPVELGSVEGLRAFVSSPEGKRVVATLVRENKKRKIGVNMMDIIVCGAVPPYTFLLGGKLVAMLMASPIVKHNYEAKYKNYKSDIASRMKQEPVIRKPELVFLGTTSLYHSGSSQYNRISIPVEEQAGQEIKYEEYGKTLGFGSVHYSMDTVQVLRELQDRVRGASLINNRFGEGINPKFRQIRAGLSSIGLDDSDHFTKHRSKRIVYGVCLGQASYEFLRGETDDPKCFFDSSSDESIERGTQQIVQHWVRRWLLMRIQQKDVLKRVSSFDVDQILVSHDIGGARQV